MVTIKGDSITSPLISDSNFITVSVFRNVSFPDRKYFGRNAIRGFLTPAKGTLTARQTDVCNL
jgi:hypothetical protein